jgi:hypothetical protein
VKDNELLPITSTTLREDPFPHLLLEEALPEDLFRELKANYPTDSDFVAQRERTGLRGSRTGNGFDIYRGDRGYDDLLARSPAWRKFDAYISSTEFVDAFLEKFSPKLESLGCLIDPQTVRHSPEFVEPRSTLTTRKTIREIVAESSFRLRNTFLAPKPHELFTRLDIHCATERYEKPVHCDRPNRLCSLILYFSDAEEIGLEGGELTLHRHKDTREITRYERYPKASNVELAGTIVPRENLGVLFACCNNSYHAVNEVRRALKGRQYLYITVSTQAPTAWSIR